MHSHCILDFVPNSANTTEQKPLTREFNLTIYSIDGIIESGWYQATISTGSDLSLLWRIK